MSAWTGEQVCTAFLTCKLSCEQFLNSIISKFFEGGGGGVGDWKRRATIWDQKVVEQKNWKGIQKSENKKLP